MKKGETIAQVEHKKQPHCDNKSKVPDKIHLNNMYIDALTIQDEKASKNIAQAIQQEIKSLCN